MRIAVQSLSSVTGIGGVVACGSAGMAALDPLLPLATTGRALMLIAFPPFAGASSLLFRLRRAVALVPNLNDPGALP